MAKDPGQRHQTPQELIDDLLAALAGPVRRRDAPGLPAPRQAPPRRFAWWWGAAAGAAVLALLAGWAAGGPEAAPPSVATAAAPAPVANPVVPATPPERIWLADLTPSFVQSIPASRQDGPAWGFGVGRFGTTGVPIRVRGQTYPRGLALHPPADATPARLVYRLDGAWARFTARAAINDTSDYVVQGRRGNHSPLVFSVLGDGRELWRSAPINTGDPAQPVDVAIAGVASLELRVDIDGVFHCCQSVWLDPELSR